MTTHDPFRARAEPPLDSSDASDPNGPLSGSSPLNERMVEDEDPAPAPAPAPQYDADTVAALIAAYSSAAPKRSDATAGQLPTAAILPIGGAVDGSSDPGSDSGLNSEWISGVTGGSRGGSAVATAVQDPVVVPAPAIPDGESSEPPSDWRWVEQWRQGGESTPWGPGLGLAGFTALVIGSAIYVISQGLSDQPLLMVVANVVVAAGLAPALWMSRSLPVLRWISLGGGIGAVVAWISLLFFRQF